MAGSVSVRVRECGTNELIGIGVQARHYLICTQYGVYTDVSRINNHCQSINQSIVGKGMYTRDNDFVVTWLFSGKFCRGDSVT